MRIIGNDPSTPRQAQIVASGTLPSGVPVVVNSDGTVSAAGVNTVSTSLGTDTKFLTTSNVPYLSAVYDPVNDKTVIIYADGNNDYGTAVVATVDPSDNSISFGTPVVFESAETVLAQSSAATYDAASGNIVIVYEDVGNNGGAGTAIVGTVSGTSISFGTPVVYASVGLQGAIENSVAYSTESQKVLVCYRDNPDGNKGKALVGTVSGTSISFGTTVVFHAASTPGLDLAYSPESDSFLVVYSDGGNGYYGTATVATISGTSVSFGTDTVFYSDYTGFPTVVYDPSSTNFIVAYRNFVTPNGYAFVATVSGTNVSFGSTASTSEDFSQLVMGFDESVSKPVLFWRDGSNNLEATYIILTVSGTTITFGSKAVLNSVGRSDRFGVAYDSTSKRLVVASQNQASVPSSGVAQVLTVGGSVQNLTANNYIGTAATGAPSGTGAKINLKGAVDENQSGLTAGQSYYVQTDGTLGTTPADPSVFAGTAVAATKLIVKG
jgi:hypothetical protein